MKRRLAWLGVGLLAITTSYFGLLLAIRVLASDVPWPPTAWSPPQGPFKVAVLGDIQKGLSNAKNLVEELRKEGVSLTIQTGDLVGENDEGHYRLAARCLRKLPGSFLAVPGNHDVKGGYRIWAKELGATEFVLPGAVTLVGLDNSDGRPLNVQHLEKLTAGKEAVLLFFHIPTSDPDFLAWLEKSPHVKYVFNGHRHEYSETRVGSTTVIVNGIGGDYDSWQLDQKVCAVVLDVEGTSIRHRVLTLPPEHGLWDNLEHAALGHLGAWAYFLETALLAATVLGIQKLKNSSPRNS